MKLTAACGGEILLRDEETIKSPGYDTDRYYDVGQECTWRIRVCQVKFFNWTTNLCRYFLENDKRCLIILCIFVLKRNARHWYFWKTNSQHTMWRTLCGEHNFMNRNRFVSCLCRESVPIYCGTCRWVPFMHRISLFIVANQSDKILLDL